MVLTIQRVAGQPEEVEQALLGGVAVGEHAAGSGPAAG